MHTTGAMKANISSNSQKCGADVQRMGELIKHGRPEAMLSHPLQAIACVRQAASAPMLLDGSNQIPESESELIILLVV